VPELWTLGVVRTVMRVLGFMVLLALMAGCKQPSPTHTAAQAQNKVSVNRIPSDADLAAQMSAYTRLKHLIARADRIVAVNGALEHTISGKSAKNVVRAISSARPFSPCDCDSDWDLKFYRNTNYLATVRIYDNLFEFENEQYYDTSGTLESLYWDALAEREPGVRLSQVEARKIAERAFGEKNVHSPNYVRPITIFDSQTGRWKIFWLKREASEGFCVIVDDRTGSVVGTKRILFDPKTGEQIVK